MKSAKPYVSLSILFSTLFFVTSLFTSSAMALTDSYFVMGEDIDMMMESDKTYTVEEIEYKLRKIPLFRELEDFMFKLQDEYISGDDEQP